MKIQAANPQFYQNFQKYIKIFQHKIQKLIEPNFFFRNALKRFVQKFSGGIYFKVLLMFS